MSKSIYDYIDDIANVPEMPLGSRQDSSKYAVTMINMASAKKTGGYTMLRATTTRPKRRKFATGFTNLTEPERAELEDFWVKIGSGSKSFLWTQPITGDKIRVIFPEGFSPVFKYAGVGTTYFWNCDLELEEA